MDKPPLDTLLRHLRRLASPAARSEEPDRVLLARFAARGDADAFEELLRRHGGMVLGVCRRLLRDPHDAEDAFQATMLTLARKAGRIRRPDALAAWLYRVASCAALQARLAAARRSSHERRAPARRPAEPFQEVSAREAQAALDQELAGLPERYRAPLVLCYLEGRTRDEAAGQLNWSLGTLKRRLEQGRTLLRARLTRRGLALGVVMSAGLFAEGTAPAAVPVGLRDAAVRVALLAVSGAAAAGSVPAEVAALACGVSRALLAAKLRVAATLFLGLGLLAAGAGVLARQKGGTQPPATGGAAPQPAAAADRLQAEATNRTDLYGDPLPAGALVRMGTVRLRHGQSAAVAFSRDGKMLISANALGIRFWDPVTGKPVRTARPLLPAVPDHLFGTRSAGLFALTADARTVAAGDGKLLHLWDVPTGKEIGCLGLHARSAGPVTDLTQLTLSADAKAVAAVSRGNVDTVYLWDVVAGQERWHRSLQRRSGRDMAFSPDGKLLALSDGNEVVRLWDTRTGKQVRTMKTVPWCFAFSPDGNLLASAGGGPIRLWDVATAKEQAALQPSTNNGI